MVDVETILQKLGKRSQVFWSEADFQHELAFEIHTAHPDAEIRLEKRPLKLEQKVYHDISVQEAQRDQVFIELKFTTRFLDVESAGERFQLKDQRAQDVRRYDFLADIERLETTVAAYEDSRGVAILLTNDRTYWDQPDKEDTIDADFRLHPGNGPLTGDLEWSEHAAAGSTENRNDPIHLSHAYALTWRDYSEPAPDHDFGQFRYLLLDVPPG